MKDKLYLFDFSKYEAHEDGTIFSKYWNRNLEGTVLPNHYVHVSLKCTDGKQRKFLYHRVIWYYFNGEIPKGYDVHHKDNNPLNNALDNLELLSEGEHERLHKNKHHVRQFDLQTNETIKVWFNAKEAAKELGFVFSTIYDCCKGGYFHYVRNKWVNVTQAYGFGWEFID